MTTFTTATGLQLALDKGSVTALSVCGSPLPLREGARPAFSVIDMAEKGRRRRVFRPAGKADPKLPPEALRLVCRDAGLALSATVSARAGAIQVKGRIENLRGGDRAVSLFFSLPVDAPGLVWHDDIRRSRPVADASLYERTEPTSSGSGAMSVYPVGCVTGAADGVAPFGVALGLDPFSPAPFRIGYDGKARELAIRFDLGLAPEPERFPNAADFSFVVLAAAPAWGFRSAWQAYMEHFASAFAVRCRRQGIWMPFSPIEDVEGWEDFGFGFHEINDSTSFPFDKLHGIETYHYTEPFTLWLQMPPDRPRTYANAIKTLREQAKDAAHPRQARRAQSVFRSGMMTQDGKYVVTFHELPWVHGACLPVNPNPDQPGKVNGCNTLWNDEILERLHGPGSLLSGEYLDSVEGYTTPELNFRRDNFRYERLPLAFDAKTFAPGIHKGLSVWEYARRLSDDMHARDKTIFGNGLPYRFPWLLSLFDIMGTETVWLGEKKEYAPIPDAQLALWRTLSGAKPYLLLQNTDFHYFDHSMMDRYLQRALFYGIYPSQFSVDAANNPYWRDPELINRDRDLFKRYIPLVREVGEAGWQPVTNATASNPDLFLERFGSRYVTVYNETAKRQRGRVCIEFPAPAAATERLSGATLKRGKDGAIAIDLAPQSVAVLDFGQSAPA